MPAPGWTTLTTSEADDQREGGDDLEVEQRLGADAADLLHVADAGDAGDDGAEDDRGDHHLDQLDEAIAQRLHGGACGRGDDAQEDPESDRHQDPEIQRAPEFVHKIRIRPSWRAE